MVKDKKFKVLIIDDEEDIIGLLTLHLKMKQYQVVAAIDGSKGLEAADIENPDIILLDVMMPGMDGFEVCKHLKEKPSTTEIPIIFLTARNQSDDRVKGLMSGADDYMVKPFDFDELELRIRRSLKNSRPKSNAVEINILDLDSMREKLSPWFSSGNSFDLFFIELVFDENRLIPNEVLKDFGLTLMLSLREVKPKFYLAGKLSNHFFCLFVQTQDLESLARLLIDNFKKNSQQAYLKIKIRPNIPHSYKSSEEFFDKLTKSL